MSAAGFKTVVRWHVELRVADRMALDFRLDIGAPAETRTQGQPALKRDRREAGCSAAVWRFLAAIGAVLNHQFSSRISYRPTAAPTTFGR